MSKGILPLIVIFGVGAAAEWIRIDLLLTVPSIAAINLGLSWYALRSSQRIVGSMLSLSVVSIPVLFFVTR